MSRVCAAPFLGAPFLGDRWVLSCPQCSRVAIPSLRIISFAAGEFPAWHNLNHKSMLPGSQTLLAFLADPQARIPRPKSPLPRKLATSSPFQLPANQLAVCDFAV